MLMGSHRLHGPLRLAGFIFVGAAALSLITNNHDGPGRHKVIPPVPPAPKIVSKVHALGDLSAPRLDRIRQRRREGHRGE